MEALFYFSAYPASHVVPRRSVIFFLSLLSSPLQIVWKLIRAEGRGRGKRRLMKFTDFPPHGNWRLPWRYNGIIFRSYIYHLVLYQLSIYQWIPAGHMFNFKNYLALCSCWMELGDVLSNVVVVTKLNFSLTPPPWFPLNVNISRYLLVRMPRPYQT